MKHSITFFLNKRKPDAADGNLRCKVAWDGGSIVFNVGYSVMLDSWNSKAQCCKPRTVHTKGATALEINRAIEDVRALVMDILDYYSERAITPTRELFRERMDVLLGKSKAEKDTSIFPIYEEYIRDGIQLGRWRDSTMKKIAIVRKHLYAMSPRLTFDDLSESGMQRVVTYLSSLNGKRGAKGLANPTINKEISVIKCFLRWSESHGYCTQNKFVTQKAHLKAAVKTIVFLTWDELMALYNYDFGNLNYLAQVRDVFCFCCFTSLRYSDVRNLKRADVSDNSITVTTVKTDDRLVIELNKYSRAILERYSGMQYPGDMALPVISNQRMNDYIKQAAKMCGIDSTVTVSRYQGNRRTDEEKPKYELLSTHAGRRTFICNALTLGIPPSVVMKWTGHSDYKAMQPYIDIADNVKQQAMALFDNR